MCPKRNSQWQAKSLSGGSLWSSPGPAQAGVCAPRVVSPLSPTGRGGLLAGGSLPAPHSPPHYVAPGGLQAAHLNCQLQAATCSYSFQLPAATCHTNNCNCGMQHLQLTATSCSMQHLQVSATSCKLPAAAVNSHSSSLCLPERSQELS